MSDVSVRRTRMVILDRAEELFARSGYEAIGVQEIVTAAGVTKPTLYHYFGSKLGVLKVLFAERFQPFLDDLTIAAAHDESLTGCLKRVVEICFAFARGQPLLYGLHLASWFGSPDNAATTIVRSYVVQQQTIIGDLFARMARDHGNMRGLDRIHAVTLIGAINSRIALAAEGGPRLDDHAVWQTVQYFSHGIYS